jgi:transposase
MKSLHPRCAALDVHKETVVACARVQKGTRVARDVTTFATTTAGLLALVDWLAARRCTLVAMEATGVYWKPVWHVLEGSCDLILANAAAVRNVPGRKSDVTDAVWLADLLAHGLIRASLVPPAPIQALRDLTRTRKQLVRHVAQHTLRIQKTLEDANLKITGIVTDLLGPSGRAILRALIGGETDPERLLAQTTGRLRAPRPRLLAGLHGAVTSHHRFLLQLHLEQIEALERAIAQLEARVADLTVPVREHVDRLTTIPGVSHLVAHVLVAEVGLDMTRFPTPAHLRSWAGLCPRLDESAGKRRSTRLRRGAPWLKTTLVQAAWAAVKVKQGYFRAQFLRLRARRGPKKAIIAVAASILTVAYCILRDGTPYRDLGATYFDAGERSHILKRLTRRIEALGYHVAVRPAGSPPAPAVVISS